MFQLIIAPLISEGDEAVRFYVNTRIESLLENHLKKAKCIKFLLLHGGDFHGDLPSTTPQNLNVDIGKTLENYKKSPTPSNSLQVLLVSQNENINYIKEIVGSFFSHDEIQVVAPRIAVVSKKAIVTNLKKAKNQQSDPKELIEV